MSERDEQELIERIARELRAGVRFDASFDDRVMAAVRESEPPTRVPSLVATHRRRGWLLRPRAIRVSPLVGLAAAAGFAGLMVAGTLALNGSRGSSGSAGVAQVDAPSDEATIRVVQFVLHAPNASSVSLVGDFNEWNPKATPLRAVSRDWVWTVSLPLPAGRHVYAFVVDDTQWVADPEAPTAPGDDFGVPNSLLTVGASS